MNEKIRKECNKTIKEWKKHGGFINCLKLETPIFCDDETVYFYWIKAEKLPDTIENQKEFCRRALKLCNVYSDKEIEKFLKWD